MYSHSYKAKALSYVQLKISNNNTFTTLGKLFIILNKQKKWQKTSKQHNDHNMIHRGRKNLRLSTPNLGKTQHKVDVASLVILCDDEENYRPNKYKKGIWGCELNFTFPIVKLLDFAENWAKMENDGNPFAIVVMAQLKAKEIKDGRQRKYWKSRLTRMLYERGYDKQDIIDLYCFYRLAVGFAGRFRKRIYPGTM